MLYIAAGALKGMKLAAPRHLRATEGKVRQALFNILGQVVAGARVVDVCAGSGALGLEALSRGAREVVLLETDPVCLAALERTLSRIPREAVEGGWRLVPGDALRSLKRMAAAGERYEVILLDPPYEGPVAKKALNLISECAILTDTGVVAVEHAQRLDLPSSLGLLRRTAQHRYGGTVLSFYGASP